MENNQESQVQKFRYKWTVLRYTAFNKKKYEYKIIKLLGSKGNATILLAEGWVPDELEELLVIKTASLPDLVPGQDILQEYSFLADLGTHPNVLRSFGVDLRPSTTVEPPKIVLVSEYCRGGDLADRITTVRLSNDQTKHFARQALCGLKFLHNKKIAHTDIKGANLFLMDCTDYPTLKIGDVDDPVRITRSKTNIADKSKHCRRGTVGYNSPEKLSADDEVGRMADIWSVGVVVVDMLRGKDRNLIFKNANTGDILEVFDSGPHRTRPERIDQFVLGGGIPVIPQEADSILRNMLSKCLLRDPKERSSAESLLDEFGEHLIINTTGTLTTNQTLQNEDIDQQRMLLQMTLSLRIVVHEVLTNTSSSCDLLTFKFTDNHCLLYDLQEIGRVSPNKPLHVWIKSTRILTARHFAPVSDRVVALTVELQSDRQVSAMQILNLPNLAVLTYFNCKQATVFSGDVAQFPQLRAVIFQDTIISDLPTESLALLSQLELIHLSFNTTGLGKDLDFTSVSKFLGDVEVSDRFEELRQMLSLHGQLIESKTAGQVWNFRNCRSRMYSNTENLFSKIQTKDIRESYHQTFQSPLQEINAQPRLILTSRTNTLSSDNNCCTAYMNKPSDDYKDSTQIIQVSCESKTDIDHVRKFFADLHKLIEADETELYARIPIEVVLFGQRDFAPDIFGQLSTYIFRLVLTKYDEIDTTEIASLKVPELRHLLFSHCRDILITSGSLDKFEQLRSVELYESTAKLLQNNVFAKLKCLEHIALDNFAAGRAGEDGTVRHLSAPIFENEYQHLKRFHCEQRYQWLRNFFRANPFLIAAKTALLLPFDRGFYWMRAYSANQNFNDKFADQP